MSTNNIYFMEKQEKYHIHVQCSLVEKCALPKVMCMDTDTCKNSTGIL